MASPSNQVFTYEYDLTGRISEIQYPTDSGVVAKFSDSLDQSGWDANGQLTHLRYLKGGNLLRSFAYQYDHSGNRKQMVDTPASGPAITWEYSYDWLNRLSSVSKDSVLQSVYSYDESDNRIEFEMPTLSQTHTYSYDLADRLLSRSLNSSLVETFEHDADGNMLARTAGGNTTTYRWDSFDKLVAVTTPSLDRSFQYDSEGIRKKSGSDTRHFSSGAMSLADLRPTNSISWIQGHQLMGLVQNSDFYWYLSDGLGSVRLVVDSDGDVQASTDYDEFGREVSSSGSADLRQHTYTGALGVRNETAELGLLYARQRWYDVSTGRWLSPDPIGFAGGLNLYGYVNNDPLNFSDPDGLQPPPIRIRLSNPRNPNYRPPGPRQPGVLPQAVPEFRQQGNLSQQQYTWYRDQINNARNTWPDKWNFVQQEGRQFEAHHAWPKFMGGSPGNQDLVKLDPMYHQVITSAMNRRLRGRKFRNDCERLQFLQDFYRDYPLIPHNATSGPTIGPASRPAPTLQAPQPQWWEWPGAI